MTATRAHDLSVIFVVGDGVVIPTYFLMRVHRPFDNQDHAIMVINRFNRFPNMFVVAQYGNTTKSSGVDDIDNVTIIISQDMAGKVVVIVRDH
jgi:hypothetical protein